MHKADGQPGLQGAGALTPEVLHGDASVWLPRLTRLLDEQAELCAGLDALSAQQSRAVNDGDTDALLRILGQRQPVVDRMSEINGLLEPFRSRKEALIASLARAQRDGVMQRVGRIAALVESVRARDDQDRIKLEQQRTTVADELATLSRGRGAATAYASAAANGYGAYARSASSQDRQG
jgi:flagellar biosynthesis/type III secretory pathway chaperone